MIDGLIGIPKEDMEINEIIHCHKSRPNVGENIEFFIAKPQIMQYFGFI